MAENFQGTEFRTKLWFMKNTSDVSHDMPRMPRNELISIMVIEMYMNIILIIWSLTAAVNLDALFCALKS